MFSKDQKQNHSGIDFAYKCLVEEGVRFALALPDSQISPLCKKISDSDQIKYIQATHESVCVGMATGLNLCGVKSIVIMENSGLRSACETIARFHLSHNLYTCYLLPHRGAFGERNWWGQAHHETLEPLLTLLRFRWEFLDSLSDFPELLKQAYSTLAAGQSSVALIAQPRFIKDMLSEY